MGFDLLVSTGTPVEEKSTPPAAASTVSYRGAPTRRTLLIYGVGVVDVLLCFFVSITIFVYIRLLKKT